MENESVWLEMMLSNDVIFINHRHHQVSAESNCFQNKSDGKEFSISIAKTHPYLFYSSSFHTIDYIDLAPLCNFFCRRNPLHHPSN